MPRYVKGKLHIDTVEIPGVPGTIGMCSCPGSGYLWGHSSGEERGVESDLETLQEWGANGVVSFIQSMEFHLVHAPDLGQLIQDREMWWKHLPIRDMSTPSKQFEALWQQQSPDLHARLLAGERIALHCLAGLGRAGMITARLMVEFGVKPRDAIAAVRASRPGTIQTWRQKFYVSRCKKVPALVAHIKR